MADATDIATEIAVGDEIIIIGEDDEQHIFADELAAFLGTINYELVCRIGMRVPRIYNKEFPLVHPIPAASSGVLRTDFHALRAGRKFKN